MIPDCEMIRFGVSFLVSKVGEPVDVRFSDAARRGLKTMPTADRVAVVAKLVRYAADGTGDVVKLVGQRGYRLRHGNWRAIFDLIDGVYVVRIAHRKEVYR